MMSMFGYRTQTFFWLVGWKKSFASMIWVVQMLLLEKWINLQAPLELLLGFTVIRLYWAPVPTLVELGMLILHSFKKICWCLWYLDNHVGCSVFCWIRYCLFDVFLELLDGLETNLHRLIWYPFGMQIMGCEKWRDSPNSRNEVICHQCWSESRWPLYYNLWRH